MIGFRGSARNASKLRGGSRKTGSGGHRQASRRRVKGARPRHPGASQPPRSSRRLLAAGRSATASSRAKLRDATRSRDGARSRSQLVTRAARFHSFTLPGLPITDSPCTPALALKSTIVPKRAGAPPQRLPINTTIDSPPPAGWPTPSAGVPPNRCRIPNAGLTFINVTAAAEMGEGWRFYYRRSKLN